MDKTKYARYFGVLSTSIGALAAFLANDYTTAVGLVGAAIAGMSTAPDSET